MHTTSFSLLERLRQSGKPEAEWKRFVQLYTPLLFYWARKLGLTAPDAADLVQDVFVVLVQKLPEFVYDRQKKNFRGWLRTILFNKWRDLCRRRKGRQGPVLSEELPDDAALFAEEEYRAHLVQQALQLMQAEFQPTTWKACWEYMILDRPAEEVARELGMTVNAVYLAKTRVLSRLRQELEGLLD
jgi:RNA polymerase sigma-70 factor, ECF subfamily